VLERGRAARIRLVAQLLDGLSDRDRQALDKAAEIIGRIV